MGEFFPRWLVTRGGVNSLTLGLAILAWLGSLPALADRRDVSIRAVLTAAHDLLENSGVSYAYGGGRVGSSDECAACNQCLLGPVNSDRRGAERLRACPLCQSCSLDCSHFVHLVYSMAGKRFPFMTSIEMGTLDARSLRQRYGWQSIDGSVALAAPGDLVVYKGHVVMVERSHGGGLADIIHATSGRDLNGPGTGIQRERLVNLASFRGPALRLLRHESMLTGRESIALGPVFYVDDLQRTATHPRLRRLGSNH